MELPIFWQAYLDSFAEGKLFSTLGTYDLVAKATRSPEAMADYAVASILRSLNQPHRHRDFANFLGGVAIDDPDTRTVVNAVRNHQDNTFYGIIDARRDLKREANATAREKIMKGHVCEKVQGFAAIGTPLKSTRRDPATGKRKRKWHTLEATGKRQAQIECANSISAIEGGTYIEPNKMTLAQFLIRWLRTHQAERLAPHP